MKATAKKSRSKSATKPRAASTETRLVAAALSLIDEVGGCRGVNLRRIADVAGCAHTNAYNFFSSYEGLLWASLRAAFDQLFEFTQRRLESTSEGTSELQRFIEAQVDFAVEHPGLYRLMWLEPLAGGPPQAVIDQIAMMREVWVRFMTGQSTQTQTSAVALRADSILHGYLHGEICKLISGRSLSPPEGSERARIVSNVQFLVERLQSDEKSPVKEVRRKGKQG